MFLTRLESVVERSGDDVSLDGRQIWKEGITSMIMRHTAEPVPIVWLRVIRRVHTIVVYVFSHSAWLRVMARTFNSVLKISWVGFEGDMVASEIL